jgi:hypothetical protein
MQNDSTEVKTNEAMYKTLIRSVAVEIMSRLLKVQKLLSESTLHFYRRKKNTDSK